MTIISALYASGSSKTEVGRWTIIVAIYVCYFTLHGRTTCLPDPRCRIALVPSRRNRSQCIDSPHIRINVGDHPKGEWKRRISSHFIASDLISSHRIAGNADPWGPSNSHDRGAAAVNLSECLFFRSDTVLGDQPYGRL